MQMKCALADESFTGEYGDTAGKKDETPERSAITL
jgi:hypothetical protein